MNTAESGKSKIISKQLRQDILNGKFDVTRKLPSDRELMNRYSVARATIQSAMRELTDERLISRQPGRGTFLADRAEAVATRTFGIIMPDAYYPFYATIQRGIEAAAKENGWRTLSAALGAGSMRERAVKAIEFAEVCVRERVAGVFVQPLQFLGNSKRFNREMLSLFKNAGIPAVLLDSDYVLPPDSSASDIVGIDNTSAGYLLARHVIEQGAKRIWYFSNPNPAPTSLLRGNGVGVAVREANLRWGNDNIFFADPTDTRAAERLFAGRNRPDAIIAVNDYIASILLKTLKAIGKRVPEDVLLAGFNGDPVAEESDPPLTTVAQPCHEIGQTAVSLMMRRLSNTNASPCKILLDVSLRPRLSTAFKAAKALLLGAALSVFALGGSAAQGEMTLPLDGVWQLREQGCALPSVPMRIPGGVHTALREANLAPDYYWGTNETLVTWIGLRNWEAARAITVPAALAEKSMLVLRLEGADTYVDVYVNGKRVGQCDDYFRRWTFDVKNHIKAGTNDVRLVFRSAHAISDYLGSLLTMPLPCNFPKFVAHSNLIRKPACNAGWDWGVSLMTAGVSDAIALIGTDDARIDYVQTRQIHAADACDLDVAAEVVVAQPGRMPFEVAVGDVHAARQVYLAAGRHTVRTRLTIPNPRLWWPNGQGEQNLYPMTVRVGGATLSRKIGLRTVELVNDRDLQGEGLTMTFRINGRDVFMKGANWIPCDATLNGQTDAKRRDLLESAKAANMNMIRVWGGGRFETDGFYNACDELGLLVWQDFMMACSKYPGFDPWFAESIRREAEHQVKRLSDHPSIALWCGDNEILGGVDWFTNRKGYNWYEKAYFRLNDAIRHEVEEHDPDRTFWPSSPCAGPGDMANTWEVDTKGDMHYWGVWHEAKPFSSFYDKRPRFCSEFGFQSFPSEELAERYAPAPIDVHEPCFAYHQKNVGGNERILKTMEQHFKVPTRTSDLIYLSQVQQALAIKTAVEFWRSIRPRCMGTLVWQLNDNWPVASWSSIEYGGKWKMLHYQEKRSYAPLMITAVSNGVYAVNDNPRDCRVTAVCECIDFDGASLARHETNVVLKAGSAQKVGVLSQWEGRALSRPREGRALSRPRSALPCFWHLTLVERGKVAAENDFLYRPVKDCPVAAANVDVAVGSEGPTSVASAGGTRSAFGCVGLSPSARVASAEKWNVTLTADKPVFYIWANVKNIRGEFDDNFVTFLPGKPRTLHWCSKQGPVSPDDFRRALTVKH